MLFFVVFLVALVVINVVALWLANKRISDEIDFYENRFARGNVRAELGMFESGSMVGHK